MTEQVKICGLIRAQDVEAAIGYGADFLGFIVDAKSPRRLSVEQAALLSLPAKGAAKTVAVTVNADDNLIAKIVSDMQPDYIQFHGDETAEHIARVAKQFGVGTIKAMKVRSSEDLKSAEEFSGVADIMLYDAPPPAGSDVQGGHGHSFDWTLLRSAPLPKIWALAGGLTPDNIAEALTATRAPIYDVSSGVEQSAGVKDALKIKAFIEAVKTHG